MKRALVTTWILCAVATLGGCPIYNHEDEGCYRDRDCAPGYYCEDRSGECIAESVGATSCSRPSQCASDQTCNPQGRCVSGDCTFNDCVAGYDCSKDSGTWSCVPSSASGGSAGAAGAAPTDPETAGAGGSAGLVEPGVAGMPGDSGEAGSSGQASSN